MTDVGIAASLVLAVFLAFLTLASIVAFMQYLADGEITMAFFEAPCTVVVLIILAPCSLLNAMNALVVLQAEGLARSLRGAYFLLIYPILLASFLLATIHTGFAPSLTFGWPLFILGMVEYPYAAILVRQELLAREAVNLRRLQCFACGAVLSIHKDEEWVRCPYCGTPNMNPYKEPEEATAQAARDGPEPPEADVVPEVVEG